MNQQNTPVEMTATCRQTYNGVGILREQVFNVDNEGDAADLVALHMATRNKAKTKSTPTPVAAPALTRDVKPEGDEDKPTGNEASPQKDGHYKRRDVRPTR